MAKAYISPSNATDKTINSIDRKRERERRYMLTRTREKAADIAVVLVQRLIDKHIIETTSAQHIRESMEKQLRGMIDLEDIDLQFKIAPLRTLTQDPNIVSLYITQYIIEDLIEHPKIQDVFGSDLDIYRVVDSILSRVRPR